MGFLKFIFGGDEKKIAKFKEKKQYREIATYLKSDDETIKKLALDTLIEMVKTHSLAPEDEKQLLALIDPITGISQQMLIDELTDPYEIRKIAVNEYFQQGKYPAAIYALKRAISLKPNEVSFMNNLAAVYTRNGNFDGARKIWDDILKERPKESTAIENYVTSLQIRARSLLDADKNSAEAEELLLRLLELNPHHINALYSMGEYYLNKKNHENAIEYFKRCLKNAQIAQGFSSLNEFRGNLNMKIAFSYKILDKRSDAALYYKEALAIHQWDEEEKKRVLDIIDELMGIKKPEITDPKLKMPEMGLFRD